MTKQHTKKALNPLAALSLAEATFLAKAPKSAFEKLEETLPEGSEANVDVTLRIRGALRKGFATEKKPTTEVLTKATLALFIRRLGIQREAALKLLGEVLIESAQLDAEAREILVAEHPEVLEAFHRLDQFINTLPKTKVAGSVTCTGLTVEKLAGGAQ